MLGIVLVSYNTTHLTMECLRSIAAANDAGPLAVVLIDNSDDDEERQALAQASAELSALPLRRHAMPRNIGFAAACNIGIAELLADPAIERVLLLNNDAALRPGALAALLRFADAHPEADMFGARMHRADHPDQVDSMGITLYASALASNRHTAEDTLLGPTGGLALYTRKLLETLQARHGYVFDERYFCYAEDTDVALRSILLGFEPAFFDHCVALHWGQASTGGGFSDFVLYHGIRNSIWTMAKGIPAGLLLVLSPLIVLLHGAIVVRHVLGGRARTTWRLYRDALAGLPKMLVSRRRIQASRTRTGRDVWRFINPTFYERRYVRHALRDLLPGRRRPA
ncbi:MAG TPA: glycosyltransferase family 2 protein [Rhodanobacteraceae bacterium]|nr:glycosyltransferase family 2 protein [Rhodanobacteraceae bacterium]